MEFIVSWSLLGTRILCSISRRLQQLQLVGLEPEGDGGGLGRSVLFLRGCKVPREGRGKAQGNYASGYSVLELKTELGRSKEL